MNLSKAAVNKPTTILVVFTLLTALSIYCTMNIPIDLYPDIDIPVMIVYTGYSNAGPEEVEKSITRTLESVLSGVTGLKEMTSTSQSGASMVMLEFEYGTNLDTSGNDIRDKIDMIRNYLPDDADTPLIMKLDPSMMPIMTLVITGSRTPEELSKYAEDIIQPRLEQIDGVASAFISGGREKAILVDIPRDRLDAYELTISQIAQMIAVQNITSSGGTIEQGDSNYSISAEGTYESLNDIRNTVVTYKTTSVSGKTPEMVSVLLRDVANVYEGYKDSSSLAYFDVTPCVMLSMQKQSGKNSVETAKKIRKQLAAIKAELPSDVTMIETSNTTDQIDQTISQVINSAVQGAVLAVVILFIFLRSIKSTFVIGLSIPISIFLTMGLMYFCGLTINMMTLAGLLLGIGMLVDNSIVVLENIFSYRERDTKPEVASVLGSQEMITSITASTLTSICIFLPMIMFRKMLGMMGKIFEAFAFTIVFSLVCSLVVAIVLVPVLTSKYLKLEKPSERKMSKPMKYFDAIMSRFFDWLNTKYSRAVRWVLNHKKTALGFILLLFFGSMMLIPKIGFIFMPSVASTTITVKLEMPKGTTIEATREVIQQMQANVLPDITGVKYSTVSVGGTSVLSSSASSNEAQLIITLYRESEREPGWDNEVSAKEKIRRHFDSFPGASFSFSTSGMAGSGGIEVVIKSDDLNLARSTAKQIEKVLTEKAKDYINEVSMDLEDGLPQLKIIVDRNRMNELGVTAYAAGNELNASINGTTASRYDDNGTQIDIITRLDKQDRTRFGDLEQIYVSNSMNNRIPLASFARYEETVSPVAIKRENQTRAIHVTAKPKDGISIGAVQSDIQKLIRENVVQDENVIISYTGDFADMMEAVANFGAIIIMAILLVFAVMASQFESLKDPFIVIFTIPLSFIGVVAIYLFSGTIFNVVTIVGMLMLVGCIVNNGIVLVDYTNLLRKRGQTLKEACVEAAQNRLRPILMSTLTTVTSLIPMAFFPGEGSDMTQPIGLTVLGGMTFGSLMTLFIMPALYYIFNSQRERKAARRQARIEHKAARSAQNQKAAVTETAGKTSNPAAENAPSAIQAENGTAAAIETEQNDGAAAGDGNSQPEKDDSNEL
ncbi:MAG: efflux RND transporter permease subunit [Bacteroides sp.]|nr:efflux RND transporter permease subunit [Prevotella sp.]MCM1407751.1 efflux RND transporter permease subunit [Treponema brennaborense]MCM1469099.1 efflux RND transporter permease subunit [Bacteroides sp.]